MRTPTATFARPASLAEALALLADADPGDRVTVVAGGTDVLVGARSGKHGFPERIVSLHALDELRSIETHSDGTVTIGALASHAQIERSALASGWHAALADASALVGSPATRNLGTLGGNLCNASPAMEAGGPLLVLDARVRLAAKAGTRSAPVAGFLRGPGSVDLAATELLVALEIPPPPLGRVGSAYLRLGFRKAMEIAVVGAAVGIALADDGAIADARIALTAVAPTVVRATSLEQLLVGQRPADAVAAVDAADGAEVTPIDDVRASARYRARMTRVIVRRALERALERAGASQ